MMLDSPTDILPTALAVTGINQLPGSKPLDGKNIMPALTGQVDKIHDTLYWSSGKDGKWAVLHGDWKYVFERGDVGLFDLSKDIAEANNLKDSHPEKLQELTQIYDEWFAQMGEPVSGSKNYVPKAGGKKKQPKKKTS